MLKICAILLVIIVLGLVSYNYSARNKNPDTAKVDQVTSENLKETTASSQTVNSPAPIKEATNIKSGNWKIYEDEQVKIEYPESWNIHLDSGKIGKIKVVSIHDPSTMKWEVTHTQQSGAENPTRFVNFNSYNFGYKTIDEYFAYESGNYKGLNTKKFSKNGKEYGFASVNDSINYFMIVENGNVLRGSTSKAAFDKVATEGIDSQNEEISIIRSITLK